MPEEIWMEVCDILQEAGIKNIPKKKKFKKAKWLYEEALQIGKKRREEKGKGEKETYSHLNAEFQRIARRDEKAFLSDQCKEIKERNNMDLTEGEDIKKKWQEYTEELYKKTFMTHIITIVWSLT